MMESDVTLFFQFLMLEKGLATNSLEAYRRDIQRYAVYLELQGVTTSSAVTDQQIAAYIRPYTASACPQRALRGTCRLSKASTNS